jgi:hypothetical protein
MSNPKIPSGYGMLIDVRDEGPVIDELCYCGALKSEHHGFQGHGHCTKTHCGQFTWFCFLKKEKEN